MPAYDIGITEINTQVRRLGYVSAILRILGSHTLNELILLTRLENWSDEHKSDLANYNNPQGEIKSTRRKTGAKRYLNLAISLGLVGRIAGACRITRQGRIFLPFLKERHSDNCFLLENPECFLYLYWILMKDTDRTLTVLDMLSQFPGCRLSHLQKSFREHYLQRLEIRSSIEDRRVAREILAVHNRVAHEWQKPERYAENIVPPRIHWLGDLRLVHISQARGKPATLTNEGTALFNKLASIADSKFKFVNTQWFRTSFFSAASAAFLDGHEEKWEIVSDQKKIDLLNEIIPEAFSVLRTTPARKISLLPALLFMCVCLVHKHNLIANLDEIRSDLEKYSKVERSKYEVRFSQRENEAYLISKPL